EAALPPRGWPNWVLGNHDQKRIASRVGEEQARIAAMLLMTLRGTPTLYYGDELGMEQVPIEGDDVHDPWEKNEPGLGFGRDPARTPMQWDASPGAGFTGVKPWLPLEESFPTRNVAAQRDDPRSMLSLVRGLLAVRNAHPALAIGAYREIDAPDSVLAFERRHGEERIVVLLNLGPDPVRFEADAVARGEILIAARPDGGSAIEGTSVDLAGDDGMVVHAS
ncbi:MAG: alpha-amylase family glycosyl hydrolase, partial [Bauldia sp.]